jgi:hypothetical protein
MGRENRGQWLRENKNENIIKEDEQWYIRECQLIVQKGLFN